MQSASPTAETLIRGSEAGFHLFDPARDDNEVERVEDAPLVRRLERFGDGKRELESGLQREGAAGKTLGQSFALDHLHDENGTTFEVEDVIESGDSGMIERSEEPCLVLQARAPLGARGELIGKDLQRDLSPEPGVASAKDQTHSAGAERTQDLVRTQALPGAKAHGRGE